eukprot:CAMPEP_0176070242 /NCGR_PEP_ID=MMETSP0120_2-20121206/35076_1 /TAXON_ID=160619 /ORGANISM="Kryptoperidinium foliaceum, Strain CCMP 1326" /LENGTH=189 /DNA_ID=CAMNT_0017403885 /DNA_START=70 /DNA_END=639 /DNA_ORIENTATION=-
MGACSSTKTMGVQRELHGLKELQAAQKVANDEMNRVKQDHSERVAKMQREHQAEVRDLHDRISRMIEMTSEENRKIQEAHVDEMRQMHERHTKEVRRIQEDHHSHMSQELMRHMEEVRKLQGEYRSQLKGLGVEMRFLQSNRPGWCGIASLAMGKDMVLGGEGVGFAGAVGEKAQVRQGIDKFEKSTTP